MAETQAGDLLRLDALHVEFPLPRGGSLTAVHSVDLAVSRSQSHGLVGESGSGKSVTAFAAIGLLEPEARASGTVWWEGQALDPAKPSLWNSFRGRGLAMMFQDARGSLNPARPIGAQLTSVLRLHGAASDQAVRSESEALLERVRLPDPQRILQAYPRELSGGMAQRVALALALACQPRLLIADEPTGSLDATVAVAIVELLRTLQKEAGLAMLVISHDMNVVRALCDQVSVMAGGRIIESGATPEVLLKPREDHTADLVDAAAWKLPAGGWRGAGRT